MILEVPSTALKNKMAVFAKLIKSRLCKDCYFLLLEKGAEKGQNVENNNILTLYILIIKILVIILV